MAKTSRLVARQAQAMESQAGLMSEVLARLERLEEKLDILIAPLPAEIAGETATITGAPEASGVEGQPKGKGVKK